MPKIYSKPFLELKGLPSLVVVYRHCILFFIKHEWAPRLWFIIMGRKSTTDFSVVDDIKFALSHGGWHSSEGNILSANYPPITWVLFWDYQHCPYSWSWSRVPLCIFIAVPLLLQIILFPTSPLGWSTILWQVNIPPAGHFILQRINWQ